MMEYRFLVAGVNLFLRSPVPLLVPDNFRPFQLPTDFDMTDYRPGMVIEVTIQSSETAADGSFGQLQKKEMKTQTSQEDFLWQKLPLKSSLELDGFAHSGHWLNYIRFADLMLKFGRPILHASAVIWEGKAWLFMAASGGGKSTQANYFRDCFGCQILNGDKVILECRENEILAFGSPVAGSSGIYRNESAPLGGVFVLKKAGENRLESVSGFQRLLTLYCNAVKSWKEEKNNEELLDLLKQVAESVPVWQFSCTNSPDAARFLGQQLTGGKG